jgi:hypothetical protein
MSDQPRNRRRLERISKANAESLANVKKLVDQEKKNRPPPGKRRQFTDEEWKAEMNREAIAINRILEVARASQDLLRRWRRESK